MKNKLVFLLLTVIIVAVSSLTSCDMLAGLIPGTGSENNGDAHEHTWSEWEIASKPTCMFVGSKSRFCECGEKEREIVPALGHVAGEWVITAEADCSNSGSRKQYCTACEKLLTTEEIPPADHDYEKIATVAPTCTARGYSTYECKNCDDLLRDDYVEEKGHTCYNYPDYDYNTTATKDGTMSGTCTVCNGKATKTIVGSARKLANAFAGKTVSILGDSISTYENVSNGTAANTTNSTIKDGVLYYTEGKCGVYRDDTWWQQAADALGASVLVNNSWSGSYIKDTSTNTRPVSGAYLERAVNLHDNTGSDAGAEPDLIFVYMGTNDFAKYGSGCGSASDIDFSSLGEKTGADYVPASVAEAYAIMLYKIVTEYEKAEIYCLNVLDNPSANKASLASFNQMISDIAAELGAYVVDICNDSGIRDDDSYQSYIPLDDGDGTPNTLHPNARGMDAITDCLLSVIAHNSEYYPDDIAE